MNDHTYPEFRVFVSNLLEDIISTTQKEPENFPEYHELRSEAEQKLSEEDRIQFIESLDKIRSKGSLSESETEYLSSISEFSRENYETDSDIGIALSTGLEDMGKQANLDTIGKITGLVDSLNDLEILQPSYILDSKIYDSNPIALKKVIEKIESNLKETLDYLHENPSEFNIDSIEEDDNRTKIKIWYGEGYDRKQILDLFEEINLDRTEIREFARDKDILPFQNLSKIEYDNEDSNREANIIYPMRPAFLDLIDRRRNDILFNDNAQPYEPTEKDHAEEKKYNEECSTIQRNNAESNRDIIRNNIESTKRGVDIFLENFELTDNELSKILSRVYAPNINLRNPVDAIELDNSDNNNNENLEFFHPIKLRNNKFDINEHTYELIADTFNNLITTMQLMNDPIYIISPEKYKDISNFIYIGGGTLDAKLEKYGITNLEFNKKVAFELYQSIQD